MSSELCPVSPETAAALMQERGEVSVCLLQRHYKLGYSDAVHLMGQVELAGLLTAASPQQPAPASNLYDLRRFVAAVRTGLGAERLKRTGATFYSQPFSLARGDFYILGTNPGGGDDGKQIIATVLDRIERGGEWCNDYLDDKTWDTPQSIQLQNTVRAMLHLLAPGKERTVCAANLIFVRSRTVADLIEGFWPLANACWPGHEVVLDVVRPKLVVAYGNGTGSAYDYLLHRFKPPKQDIEISRDAGWGSTKLKAFRFKAPWGMVRVVGLPHPSRFGLLRATSQNEADANAGEVWPILLPHVADFVYGSTS
jgi:hypothetical protein